MCIRDRQWLGRTYGATRDERHRGLAGDDLVVRPQATTTHATTIDAPPDHIWPWLVQMGWGRGQWYTARWVDLLLFPDNGPSADRLHPEWESGTIWGSYAAAAWRSGVLVNAGCHPVEVVGELVVEDPDTDLQQEVRAARGPAHLLL